MARQAFIQSILKASGLAEKAGIRSHFNMNPNLPTDYVGRVRNLSYLEQWELHDRHFWYHIKLEEQSLLYFKEDSFKYISSPFESLDSLDEYESRIKQELYDNNYPEEEIELYLDDIEQQYQLYLETEARYGSYTPLRVDIHPEQYKKVSHPITHLHIGHGNESRLPIKKYMTPFAFTGFVIATFYPKNWELLRQNNVLNDDDFRALNTSLLHVHRENADHWCEVEEEQRFYLT